MQIRLPNPWIIAVAFLLTLVTLGLLTSCRVQKQSSTRTENRDSLALVAAKAELAEVIKERDHFQKKVEELEYLAITFAECPPAVNIDSLKAALSASGCRPEDIAALQEKLTAVQSKFEKAADGSVKVQGRLASITVSKQRIEDSLHERNAEIIRLKSELAVAKSQVRTEIKTVEKEVNRGWPWWIWFTIGLVSGVVLTALVVRWLWSESDHDNF